MEDELDVLVDVVADEESGLELVVDAVVELFNVVDVAVEIVISKVVVTDSSAVTALLRKSWSLGCNIVHAAPSMYGIRVSNRSWASSSKMGVGVCFGLRYQRSSSGANSSCATAVGSGSSST